MDKNIENPKENEERYFFKGVNTDLHASFGAKLIGHHVA